VRKHAAAIARLSASHAHTIRPAPVRYMPNQRRFKCFAFAFGLADDAEYMKLSRRSRFFADSEFTRFLIEKRILREIDRKLIRAGDVVVYDLSRCITHAGRVYHGKVISKWGSGLFLEHGLCEVPQEYGNRVRFFRRLSRARALAAFREFAG
jgi:hypothetical protein